MYIITDFYQIRIYSYLAVSITSENYLYRKIKLLYSLQKKKLENNLNERLHAVAFSECEAPTKSRRSCIRRVRRNVEQSKRKVDRYESNTFAR